MYTHVHVHTLISECAFFLLFKIFKKWCVIDIWEPTTKNGE